MASDLLETSANVSGNLALSLPNVDDAGAFVRARNQAYGSECGYLYTAHSIQRVIKTRRTVTIKLTTTYNPIEVRSENITRHYSAAVIKPMVPREIRAVNAGVVVAVISPRHSSFRNFSTAPGDGILPLNRADFSILDERLQQAYLGELDASRALDLLEEVVAIAARQFRTPPPLDRRVEQAIDLLHADATHDLQALANEVSLSYYRLSHLFSEQMGMSLRSYQLWKKIDLAWRLICAGKSIQDVAHLAGFTDVTHFCRVFREGYGVPVSYVLNKVRAQFSFE